jgi:hypothetical protein
MLSIDLRGRKTNPCLIHTPDLQWILGFWGGEDIDQDQGLDELYRLLGGDPLGISPLAPIVGAFCDAEITALLAGQSPGAWIGLGASAQVPEAHCSVHGLR